MLQIRTTTRYYSVRPDIRGMLEPIKTVRTEAIKDLVMETKDTFAVTI